MKGVFRDVSQIVDQVPRLVGEPFESSYEQQCFREMDRLSHGERRKYDPREREEGLDPLGQPRGDPPNSSG